MIEYRTIWMIFALQPVFACGDGLDQSSNTQSKQDIEVSESNFLFDEVNQKNLESYMHIFVAGKPVIRRELRSYSEHYFETKYAATLLQLCGKKKTLSEVNQFDKDCEEKTEKLEYSQSDNSQFISLIQKLIGRQNSWEIISVTGENRNRIFKVQIQYGDHKLGGQCYS